MKNVGEKICEAFHLIHKYFIKKVKLINLKIVYCGFEPLTDVEDWNSNTLLTLKVEVLTLIECFIDRHGS